MKFDSRVTWANLFARTCVCLHKIMQLSRFINKNRKADKKLSQIKKIEIGLFIGLGSKSDLKVNFEANLLEHVFQTFCKNCSDYEKWVYYNSILEQIHNQICNYLCVVFLEALEHYQESPRIKS